MIARRPGRLRTFAWFLLVAAIVAVGGAVTLRVLRPAVTVTRAVEGPVVQAFYSTGTIQPIREFPIKANVGGTLVDVKVDKGSRVSRGDVLATVNDPTLQYALEKAQAELREKLARLDEKSSPVLQEYDRRAASLGEMLDIANREQNRQTQALEARAGSQADLDRSLDRIKLLTMDLEAARSQKASKQLELQREVDVARSAVATALYNVEQQTLKSPIDGVVLDRPVSQGTRVAINDSILRIADVQPANLVMRAAVDEEDVARVSADQTVRLTLYAFPGEVFRGRVRQIYDQADTDRRTFEVDVTLESVNNRLQPGMTGELAFILAERAKAIVIPSQAVQNGAVWVVDGSNELVRRETKIGIRSIERTEIISGINVGERVVVSPIGTLEPGRRVRAAEVDPAASADSNRNTVNAQGNGFKGI